VSTPGKSLVGYFTFSQAAPLYGTGQGNVPGTCHVATPGREEAPLKGLAHKLGSTVFRVKMARSIPRAIFMGGPVSRTSAPRTGVERPRVARSWYPRSGASSGCAPAAATPRSSATGTRYSRRSGQRPDPFRPHGAPGLISALCGCENTARKPSTDTYHPPETSARTDPNSSPTLTSRGGRDSSRVRQDSPEPQRENPHDGATNLEANRADKTSSGNHRTGCAGEYGNLCRPLRKMTCTRDVSPGHCASETPGRHPPETIHGETPFQDTGWPGTTPVPSTPHDTTSVSRKTVVFQDSRIDCIPK
jgi:hypothetical protein